ncbi:TRAP transporter substrate-binding protein [Elioraea sp.]|uniref:TRAP transporter substrate-binding protein n=1 Tax=Elioraea sp. TaxID=2185103 RepID=UPI0025C5A39E|nr:TRAP transporter substrate-binding protein [Elioraea sp.]
MGAAGGVPIGAAPATPSAAGPAPAAGEGPREAPLFRAQQFHNQPEESHIHGFLVRLWDGVRRDTGGLLDVTVHARCGDIPGSDPEALRMVQDGRLEFHTLMGGILGKAVAVTEMQGLPFAFRDHAHVFAAMDGPFGRYLAEACARSGILMLPEATFENGFRHFGASFGPVTAAADLAGRNVRVPDGEMFRDFVRALAAEPVTVNIRELYQALATGRAAVQENALVVMQVNRLYEVSRFLSLTGHMWSGFNLIGHLPFWVRLPPTIQAVVRRHARAAAEAQRAHTKALNDRMVDELSARGMIVNQADAETFRAALARDGFYARWRARFGEEAWAALEAATGPLG